MIPRIHNSSTLIKPAKATLGDKKQCAPTTVSWATVQDILRILFCFIMKIAIYISDYMILVAGNTIRKIKKFT